MPDVEINCVQCGTGFVFSEYDQSQYYQRNMTWPKRCKECRTPARAANAGDREKFEIMCTNCGKADRVPFKPKPGRAVLCAECHGAQKARVSRR